ncbi:MAG: DNA topoisomerase I [Candidatus Thorarchaeota archaeon]
MSRIMVISEKPMAAERIAYALDEDHSPQSIKKGKVSYFECKRGEDSLLVVYALGHLFELKQTEKGWTYPRLETQWVPKYEVDKKAGATKTIINLIKRLSREIDKFVIATDYDIEGSLIGYLTLKYACKSDPHKASRMRFSTLTREEIEQAYLDMSDKLDFPMIESGCTRHLVDWLYGINLTRALTLAIKRASGWFKIVSTGRVQGPVLSFVAEREREINTFVPVPHWAIDAVGTFKDRKVRLEYSRRRIDTYQDARGIVQDLEGQMLTVNKIRRSQNSVEPPIPFNLSGLQSEAYRHFGFKPSRTLALAQRLYLDALISYPRTSSQKIPANIDTMKILVELETQKTYSKMVDMVLSEGRKVPMQGKKDDPAHPAIHPTGKRPDRRLTPSEKKVYDLIVCRFLALFGQDSQRESTRADLEYEGHVFYLRGKRILEPGWILLYGKYTKFDEQELPPIEEGDLIKIDSIRADEKYENPPSRFNPSSLLKRMEREGLGTKATRAGIVDSLKSRGYTLNDRFEVSTLGYAVFETLENHIPKILSVEFTKLLEQEMEWIREGKRSQTEVLHAARTELLEILEKFRDQEEIIGNELVEGLQRYWREQQEIGPCPKCGEGTLMIVRSPKTGKRFLGCSRYKEGGCDQTFPLPQRGKIVPLDKKCEFCGYQMIKVVSGRRTWETCINWTECPGRQKDLAALQERRSKRKK